MSATNSTAPSPTDKPYPEFPLFRHASGQWAKKIRGKLYYYGRDSDAALEKYLKEKDDRHAGRTPRPDADSATVKDMVNGFLNWKLSLKDSGELSPLTYADYKRCCDEIVDAFGKRRLLSDIRQDDFAAMRRDMSKRWGPQHLSKTIQFVRCVFKYACDSDLVDRPFKFGPDFKRPSKKTIRLNRQKQGLNLFTRDEIKRLIDAASQPLKAMLLLGINCAFGNADCGTLPRSAVDLDKGIIDYPRPKTAVLRRCVLWLETVQAIREALDQRPEPKKPEHADLVFVTRCGDSWRKDTNDGPLSRETTKLMRELGINGRKGLGFYTLRHTFRTVGDEAKDQPATDFIMGRESPHMSSAYRETISDARLKAVSDHVHGWLFGQKKEGGEV